MLCYICYRCRKAAFSAMRVLDNRPGQSCSKPSRVDNTGGLQLFVSKVFRTRKYFLGMPKIRRISSGSESGRDVVAMGQGDNKGSKIIQNFIESVT